MNRVHDNPIRIGPLEIRCWHDLAYPGIGRGPTQRWWSLKCRGRRKSYVLKRTGEVRSTIFVLWVNR